MARARLSIADIFHRGVVISLIGVCVWGIGTGVLVHRDTLRMGRGSQIIAQREASGLPTDVVPEKVNKVQEVNEQRWAEAAQAVLRGRGPKAV
ncbi:hypothetical protein B0F90DRAFT_1621305 [Multifurca ochricompacta]|uniref:Uncharacterized protein n=1 Tax=Multifurca ochricompacta TaxID=376703 RepID=A0AAD4MDP2_9AGAM|nr:hypothetical protein B0F90DRAFT_1621305 [Multifurca ochricompacta]